MPKYIVTHTLDLEIEAGNAIEAEDRSFSALLDQVRGNIPSLEGTAWIGWNMETKLSEEEDAE